MWENPRACNRRSADVLVHIAVPQPRRRMVSGASPQSQVANPFGGLERPCSIREQGDGIMQSLKDRKVVVTGGSRGLGLGVVEALVEQGAEVTVVARGERP